MFDFIRKRLGIKNSKSSSLIKRAKICSTNMRKKGKIAMDARIEWKHIRAELEKRRS